MEITNKQWKIAIKSIVSDNKSVAFDPKSGNYRKSTRNQKEMVGKSIAFDENSKANTEN